MTTWSWTPRGTDEANVANTDSGIVTPTGTFTVSRGTGGIIKYDTAQSLFGSSCARFRPGSQVSTECTWASMGSLSKGFARFYMRMSAMPTSNQRLCFGFSNGSNSALGMDMTILGKIIGKWANNNIATMQTPVPEDQWVRIEMGFATVPTACRPFISLYLDPFSTTADETIQTASNVSIGTTVNTFRTPVRYQWNGAFDLWLDNVEVSDVAMPAVLPDPSIPVAPAATGSFFPFLTDAV